jgi:hypothetical protein
MTLESIIEYIGTPVGMAVVLAYGMKQMYKYFKDENDALKEVIKQKDQLIEDMNKSHSTKIEELVSNNIEINTLVNENIKSIRDYIQEKYRGNN